jgi:hypothetical protein
MMEVNRCLAETSRDDKKVKETCCSYSEMTPVMQENEEFSDKSIEIHNYFHNTSYILMSNDSHHMSIQSINTQHFLEHIFQKLHQGGTNTGLGMVLFNNQPETTSCGWSIDKTPSLKGDDKKVC